MPIRSDCQTAPSSETGSVPEGAGALAGRDAGPPTCFQDVISRLQSYWARRGCVVLQPYDMEVGAGTLHPATLLRALGKKSWRAVYVQPSRRPADGRYGDNPNRLGQYYQLQVILKPDPSDIQDMYLESLGEIGIDRERNDIRFLEDDWENPTVGASGLGWEVWCNGMEITQFTWFQEVGGVRVDPPSGELTYGIERLAMYVLGVENVFELPFNAPGSAFSVTYGDVFRQQERQQSAYHFERADIETLHRWLSDCERTNAVLLDGQSGEILPLPAYEQALKASHIFNLLDARGAFSPTARPAYIRQIRKMACGAARAWLDGGHAD